MPDTSQIRNFNLKILFLVHLLFTSLSSMGFWTSTTYIFYNSVLIILLLWSVYHSQNHEPIQLAIVVNGCAIILDILLLVMGFPSNQTAREKFSAAMAILHLIVRPFSTIVMIKNLEERSGATGTLSELLTGGQSQTYEDIDRPNRPTTGDPNAGGYDFSNAQQI